MIGGGSRGLGRAVADELVRQGARVLLVARNEDSLAEAVAALGERASSVAADLGSPEGARGGCARGGRAVRRPARRRAREPGRPSRRWDSRAHGRAVAPGVRAVHRRPDPARAGAHAEALGRRLARVRRLVLDAARDSRPRRVERPAAGRGRARRRARAGARSRARERGLARPLRHGAWRVGARRARRGPRRPGRGGARRDGLADPRRPFRRDGGVRARRRVPALARGVLHHRREPGRGRRARRRDLVDGSGGRSPRSPRASTRCRRSSVAAP